MCIGISPIEIFEVEVETFVIPEQEEYDDPDEWEEPEECYNCHCITYIPQTDDYDDCYISRLCRCVDRCRICGHQSTYSHIELHHNWCSER